jgi:nicotinamidase-related amidase
MLAVEAEPYEFVCDPATTALLVIDMQRDFLEPGGFGEMLGNNVSRLQRAVAPARRVLDAFRKADLTVIHTRAVKPSARTHPLLDRPLIAINVGLEVFAHELDAAGVPVAQVDWHPPAGDADVAALLARFDDE